MKCITEIGRTPERNTRGKKNSQSLRKKCLTLFRQWYLPRLISQSMIFSKIGTNNKNDNLRKLMVVVFFVMFVIYKISLYHQRSAKSSFRTKNTLGKFESHVQSIKVRKQKFFPNIPPRPPVFKQPVVFMNTFGSG